MKEFLNVLSVEEARRQLDENMPDRRLEIVPLKFASGRILAKDILCPEDLPAFNRSTVDGYAVEASDTFGCSESLPAFLDLIAFVNMGQKPDFTIQASQCAWIPTGGMLPEGSNAVVMVENTEKMGSDTVLIHRPVHPYENVMIKGEDVSRGSILFYRGHKLRAQDLGMLASLGISELKVFTPWKAGIISTGDEIIPVEQTPQGAEVRDVNSYSIAAAIMDAGGEPSTYAIVPDDSRQLKAAVERAVKENQVVFLSGGSSVGAADYSLEVLLSFPGARLLFHGIAMKPGKPTIAVAWEDHLLIGLPGHPVSALMVFQAICRPVMGGAHGPMLFGDLSENLASQAGRDDFVPVQLIEEEDGLTIRPLLGKSGLMSILARADGFIHISNEQQGLLKGQRVRVYSF